MDMPPTSVDWELLARHLSGQCTPEDAERFERWLAADERHAAFIALMREAWQASGSLPPAVDLDAAWARVAGRFDLDVSVRRPDSAGEPRVLTLIAPQSRSRSLWWRAAAVAAGVVLAVFGWRAVMAPGRPHDPFAGARAYITLPGERAHLRLPDGTWVALAAASTLLVPRDFGSTSRSVHLDGEGYFDVTHDSTRQFRVHTRDGVATDLGTKFGVRRYATDVALTVVVAEGLVALEASPSSPLSASPPDPLSTTWRGGTVRRLFLAPGDRGRLGADGSLRAEHGVPVELLLAWTDGRIVFADTPLAEVVRELNRWYDVDIRLADSALARLHVTGVFTTEPTSDVLRFLTAPLDLRYDREGRTITLRRK